MAGYKREKVFRYFDVGDTDLRHLLIAAVLLTMLAVCSPSTGHHVEQLEIDGIPLVRTIGGPKYSTPILRLESDLVIGVDEGQPEWQLFARTPGMLIAPDGRMVLSDSGRSKVFIVSPGGGLLSEIGSKGSGPGEFESIQSMQWAETGREFWVKDVRLQRVTRLSMDGEYLGSFNYSEQLSDWAMNTWGLGNSRFLGVKGGNPFNNNTTRYAFLDSELRFVEDFIQVPAQQFWQVSEGFWEPIQFTSIPGVTVFPDGRLLSFHPYKGRLTVYTTHGRPVLHIERDWDYPAVTAEDRARTLRRWRESPIQEMRDLADRLPFPKRRAAFSRVTVDDEGRIWVTRSKRLYDEGEVVAYVYDIFGSDGVWLGTHRTLLLSSPVQIRRGYVYRTFSSESEGPRLERLRIVPLVAEMELGGGE